jgi:hypothetical protein
MLAIAAAAMLAVVQCLRKEQEDHLRYTDVCSTVGLTHEEDSAAMLIAIEENSLFADRASALWVRRRLLKYREA